MKDTRIIKVYLDDEEKPFAEFSPPVKFELDTTKIPDGKHSLRIVARSSRGVEGVRVVPFQVRNGPTISLVGLKDNDEVTQQIPKIGRASCRYRVKSCGYSGERHT